MLFSVVSFWEPTLSENVHQIGCMCVRYVCFSLIWQKSHPVEMCIIYGRVYVLYRIPRRIWRSSTAMRQWCLASLTICLLLCLLVEQLPVTVDCQTSRHLCLPRFIAFPVLTEHCLAASLRSQFVFSEFALFLFTHLFLNNSFWKKRLFGNLPLRLRTLDCRHMSFVIERMNENFEHL